MARCAVLIVGVGAFHKVDGVELFDRAFQLANVALELLCDEFADVVRHTETDKLGFALDDCHAGLKVRRLHIGGKAPLKAGLQTIFQGSDVARGTGRSLKRSAFWIRIMY